MAALTPTPVALQNLIDVAAKINLFNDGIETQLVSPRSRSPEVITVQVTDDPLAPVIASGTCDANVLNSISDSSEDFIADGVEVGDAAISTVTGASALVTVVATGVLTLSADICPAGTEAYTVIPKSYWVQKFAGGEWKKSNYKKGDNKRVSYTLPTTGTVSTVLVHEVVYPVATPEDTGFYPPSANA